jgi:hypothetical protein
LNRLSLGIGNETGVIGMNCGKRGRAGLTTQLHTYLHIVSLCEKVIAQDEQKKMEENFFHV